MAAYHSDNSKIPIHYDDVDCTGSEERLTQCQHVDCSVSKCNCGLNEYAGIQCTRSKSGLCVHQCMTQ